MSFFLFEKEEFRPNISGRGDRAAAFRPFGQRRLSSRSLSRFLLLTKGFSDLPTLSLLIYNPSVNPCRRFELGLRARLSPIAT